VEEAAPPSIPGGQRNVVKSPAVSRWSRRSSRSGLVWTRLLPDALGVGWILVVSVALLLPALVRGPFLGPQVLMSAWGLTAVPGSTVHFVTHDPIAQFMPWTVQNWLQVHSGHLPLWNPSSGLGMPIAFNWQSAPFGLPALVGYVVPLRYAYTVGVIVTLFVAGSGAYFFGRVLRLGVLASTMSGT